MSGVQRAAQIFGIIFVLVAIAGFITSGTSMEADPDTAPHLLGLFPVNLVHNLVHLALGVWGLIASRDWSAARAYARISGALYLLLAVCGMVVPDGFGLVPIGGADVALHAVLGIALLAVGLTAREPTMRAA
jgi:hypothetical protein